MKVRYITRVQQKQDQAQVRSTYAEVMLTLQKRIPESLDERHAVAKQIRKALEVWQLEVDAKLEDAKSRAMHAPGSRTQDAFSQYRALAHSIELEAQAILRESHGSLVEGSRQIAEKVCEKAVRAQWEAIEGTSLSATHQPYDPRHAPGRGTTTAGREQWEANEGTSLSATHQPYDPRHAPGRQTTTYASTFHTPAADLPDAGKESPTRVIFTDNRQPNWVHEVKQIDLRKGGRTLCGLRLDSNWVATLAPVTCGDCLRSA